jgi:hypothetical protein
MGTRLAPFYANFFMDSLEEDFVISEASKLDFWLIIIDILLWVHGHDSIFLFF